VKSLISRISALLPVSGLRAKSDRELAANMIKVGALSSLRVMCTPITGTTTPSDSRCTPADFTIGLYDRALPDARRA
jgi:hypothetical protein